MLPLRKHPICGCQEVELRLASLAPGNADWGIFSVRAHQIKKTVYFRKLYMKRLFYDFMDVSRGRSEPHRNVFADLHKRIRGFSLAKTAGFLHKNGTPAVSLMPPRKSIKSYDYCFHRSGSISNYKISYILIFSLSQIIKTPFI